MVWLCGAVRYTAVQPFAGFFITVSILMRVSLSQ
jgi:hypothetical protein